MRALPTPNTVAFGNASSLPILSARDVDLSVTALVLAADAAQSVDVPTAAQAVELDLLNGGSGTVTLWLVASRTASGMNAAALGILARAVGLRRLVPPGAQALEQHGVKGGDTLVMVASGALDVRVAARLAGDGS